MRGAWKLREVARLDSPEFECQVLAGWWWGATFLHNYEPQLQNRRDNANVSWELLRTKDLEKVKLLLSDKGWDEWKALNGRDHTLIRTGTEPRLVSGGFVVCFIWMLYLRHLGGGVSAVTRHHSFIHSMGVWFYFHTCCQGCGPLVTRFLEWQKSRWQ